MRKFSKSYLRRTREGMWDDSRDALSDLSLGDRTRVLDAGAGTGELARVLDDETPGDVVCLDADPELTRVAREETGLQTLTGDATRLPFADDAFDLVVCQALLVNLPDPAAAVSAFARVSSDLVAAVEPNNADVGVDSTVAAEVPLERSVREAYIEGVGTNVALGDRVATLFEEVGLRDVRTRRYYHQKTVEPPYDQHHLESAARKANGAGIDAHETELRRVLSEAEYDALRRDWREMGRAVVEQMREGRYRRAEVVPFDVTVGRAPEAA
ncbi:class I SAM-dependent methyltransferase [Halopelagius fulvigenes]|uniref:Class I SAM-dependent methyltransferase n=1 Tax=Halopelagius fulvigenes TaxID=1198324 RepID=A0ABD5U1C0_9EURY